jgi:hypothetical protein
MWQERPPQHLVAVVVPVYRAELTPDEQVSLGQLRSVLGAYDTFLLAPRGLELELGLPVVRFAPRYFHGRRGWTELEVSPVLYEAFEDYEFVLVHQLDCLVFRDELREWCARGYDYIGAPWVRIGNDGSVTFHGVGNGGFSLRRVRSCLRAAKAARRLDRRASDRLHYAARVARRLPPRVTTAARTLARTRRLTQLRERAATALDQTLVEVKPFAGDKFWAHEAPRLVPGFAIPPAEEAVRFSIDTHPEYWLERTGGAIPFGCHGWPRNGRQLWEAQLAGRVASVSSELDHRSLV